ncbi:NADH:ubiquinone oxidoreductase subunit ASHI [Lasioglossum baleicum]|uniref:NADH:ubiquinone oxidoreductase subunit ASHI n=1 Tax=Lasioglossum baleicum TaxID=434251 RepID=UPI003FCD8B03
MAALKKFGSLPITLLRTTSPNVCIYRHISDSTISKLEKIYEEELEKAINPNFKKWYPAKRPETEEEMQIAAKRYSLHPSEYKPFPDDESSLGDYPDLPWKGVEAQDPHYPWDFPGLRRNYGEVIHYQFDMMQADRFAYGVRTKGNYYKYAALFVFYYICTLYFGAKISDSKPLYSPKQFPYKGEVHYSFPDLD